MKLCVAKTVFVFPGQGSQFAGMGLDLYEQTEIGKKMFDLADELLGFPLSKLCFEGPESELEKTINTQPALFVCSTIVYELLKERGLSPNLVMGHSLGEYSALYAAGVFDFPTGLRLVRKRGELCQQATEQAPGSMAAILGMDFSTVEQICLLAANETGKIVQPANFNSPQQLVISGHTEAVELAMKMATEQKAKRVIKLKVSAGFHSPLMQPAAESFRQFIENIPFNDAKIKFINNADAELLVKAADIKDSLVRQLTSCVRWVDSVKKAIALDMHCFVEAGPGKVLSGIIQQIDPSVRTYTAGTLDWINKVVKELTISNNT